MLPSIYAATSSLFPQEGRAAADCVMTDSLGLTLTIFSDPRFMRCKRKGVVACRVMWLWTRVSKRLSVVCWDAAASRVQRQLRGQREALLLHVSAASCQSIKPDIRLKQGQSCISLVVTAR